MPDHVEISLVWVNSDQHCRQHQLVQTVLIEWKIENQNECLIQWKLTIRGFFKNQTL